MAQDPVCGTEVDEAKAPALTTYKGHTYYFCSQTCLDRFEEEVEKYLEESPKGYSH